MDTVKAFISLSAQPQLRTAVLTEIVRWAAGEDSDELRQPGVDIFIALCLLRDEDQLILLPKSIEADHRISELAAGWRVALRNTEQASAARDVAVGWLEAAAQKAESRSVVVAIITRACRNSFDIGILSPLIWKWARSSGQTAPISREEICSELLERISQKDPLATGSSLVPRYASPEQES